MSFQLRTPAHVDASSSSSVAIRQYGISSIISSAAPSSSSITSTAALDILLRSRGLYESDDAASLRESALAELNQILQPWVRERSVELGYTDVLARDELSRILTFGSYRLGVAGPGADIDTLVVGPHFITRDMFFNSFKDRLNESEHVTELSSRADAYVPVITFKLFGVDIDLLYAQLSLGFDGCDDESMGGGGGTNGMGGGSVGSGADFNIYDDAILRGVDEKTVLSLNGARVTDMILSLMPSTSHVDFRIALRFFKLWAAERGIYSNVMGYLGGVNWAILVAHIIQLYPTASASTLVEKLFKLHSTSWKWPMPIMLNAIVPNDSSSSGAAPVWNAHINYKDLMPIITPAFPASNSTRSVSRATLKVVQREFARGHDLITAFLAPRVKGSPPVCPSQLWLDLLSPSTFFLSHADYFDICVSSRSAADQLGWSGYVESKVRQLVMPLGNMQHVNVVPYPKSVRDDNATWIKRDVQVRIIKEAVEENQELCIAAEDAITETTVTETIEKLYVEHFFIGLDFDLIKIAQEQTRPVIAAAAVPLPSGVPDASGAAAASSSSSSSSSSAAAAAAAPPVQLNLSHIVRSFRDIVFSMWPIKDPERGDRGFNCDVSHIKARQLPEFAFAALDAADVKIAMAMGKSADGIEKRRPKGWGAKKLKRKVEAKIEAKTEAKVEDQTAASSTIKREGDSAATTMDVDMPALETASSSSSVAAIKSESSSIKVESSLSSGIIDLSAMDDDEIKSEPSLSSSSASSTALLPLRSTSVSQLSASAVEFVPSSSSSSPPALIDDIIVKSDPSSSSSSSSCATSDFDEPQPKRAKIELHNDIAIASLKADHDDDIKNEMDAIIAKKEATIDNDASMNHDDLQQSLKTEQKSIDITSSSSLSSTSIQATQTLPQSSSDPTILPIADESMISSSSSSPLLPPLSSPSSSPPTSDLSIASSSSPVLSSSASSSSPVLAPAVVVVPPPPVVCLIAAESVPTITVTEETAFAVKRPQATARTKVAINIFGAKKK